MPHIHHAYDYTITAFIVSEYGKVLLVNHPRYSKWIPVGGHIELHEDPEEALFREIKEETGLAVQATTTRPDSKTPGTKFLLPPDYIDVHEANPPHKHISFTYFLKAKVDAYSMSAEHTDMKWFSVADLDDESYSLSDDVKFLAKKAVDKIYHK